MECRRELRGILAPVARVVTSGPNCGRILCHANLLCTDPYIFLLLRTCSQQSTFLSYSAPQVNSIHTPPPAHQLGDHPAPALKELAELGHNLFLVRNKCDTLSWFLQLPFSWALLAFVVSMAPTGTFQSFPG